MATIRIVASAYTRSNTNYVTVTNDSNMYNNVDHTSNYCTLRGRAGRSSNSTYYAFIHGFDFNEVPSNATVTSFKVKIRAYRGTYQATGNTNYRIALASQPSNSYKIGSTTLSSDITTTSGGEVYEIPTGSLTWDTLKNYGTNFSIDIPLRNSSTSSSNYPYVYVYGAEIEVTYTIPNPRTITTTLSGNGTIEPSGANIYYDEDEFELIITPTNSSDTVTATKNGSDITSQLVRHTGQETDSQVPTEDFTTGFSSSGANFYQSSSVTSTSWLEYAIGHSAESPYSTSNTNNTYVKPSGETGWINYHFDFDAIPSSATINSVSVKVYGARENATVDSTHVARFQCYSGNTPKGTIQNFTSTSNSLVTVSDVGTWTASELHDAQLRFEVGYYGGRMLGITWSVTYTAQDHYTYTMTVSGDATIAVTIGSSGEQPKLYVKLNGSWVEATPYKKVNGSWISINIEDAFNSTDNFINGDNT